MQADRGDLECMKALPFIVNCLDDEAECWADCSHIFSHYSLDDGCLARIIESTTILVRKGKPNQLKLTRRGPAYSIRTRSSLSLSLAFRRIDSILGGDL